MPSENVASATPEPRRSDGVKKLPARTCTACGIAVPEGADRCPGCGLAFGEHQRCPHCSAIAAVERSPRLRTVCSVCGRPRIQLDPSPPHLADPQVDTALLARAGRADLAGATWRALGYSALGFGVFGLLILSGVLAVAPAGAIGRAAAILAACIPVVLGAFSLRCAKAASRRAADALDGAWAQIVADLARVRGGVIDAATLGRATGIDENAAERLLSRMTVQDRLAREVTADAGLCYKLRDLRAGDDPLVPKRAAADPSTQPAVEGRTDLNETTEAGEGAGAPDPDAAAQHAPDSPRGARG